MREGDLERERKKNRGGKKVSEKSEAGERDREAEIIRRKWERNKEKGKREKE